MTQPRSGELIAHHRVAKDLVKLRTIIRFGKMQHRVELWVSNHLFDHRDFPGDEAKAWRIFLRVARHRTWGHGLSRRNWHDAYLEE